MRLCKYSEYRDSGIEWLGEIPKYWEIRKLGALGNFSASGIDKYSKKNEPIVKIINFTDIYSNSNYILDNYIEYMRVTTSESNRVKHLVKKGDLIFLPSSETYKDLGLSALVNEELYNTSFSYHLIRFQFEKKLNHSFKKYLTNNYTVLNQFSSYGKGSTRKIIGRNVFKNIYVILPPLQEQKKIAFYLDSKISKIDNAIKHKERLIELFKEQKQIVINRAVTKGVGSEALASQKDSIGNGEAKASLPEFKDSGVEWIGEIPKHWEVRKLKYIFKIQKRIAGKLGYDVLSITQQGIKIKDIKSGEGQLSMDYSKYQFIYKNEFAMNHMDLLTGYIDISKYDGVISPDYRVFTLEDKYSINEYFLYLFQMCYKNKIFYAYGQGVSMLGRWRFPSDNFYNFKIPIPPLQEQKKIVEYIENQTKKIDRAINLQKEYIKKLKEYKEVLINEVVTGKVRVCDE